MSDGTMEISVTGRALDHAELPAVAVASIEAFRDSIWGPPHTVSRNQGEWFPIAGDEPNVPERVPWTVEFRDADLRWHVSLSCSSRRTILRSSLDPPFSPTDRGEAIRLLTTFADLVPAADIANVRLRPDPFAVLAARALPSLPGPFEEALDWVHLLDPSVDAFIERDDLLAAPAFRVAAVDDRVLLHVYDDPNRHSEPDTFDLIEACTNHIAEHLRP